MDLSDILSPRRTVKDVFVDSKKRALEYVSQLVVEDYPEIELNTVFQGLLARERLGSTSIGCSVAIPHCRLPEITEAIAVLLVLHKGIDFNAADREPVDIVLALLVPEEATEQHLQLLAMLAEKFSDAKFRGELRESKDNASLYQVATAK